MAPFLPQVPEVTALCRHGGSVSAEGGGMQPLVECDAPASSFQGSQQGWSGSILLLLCRDTQWDQLSCPWADMQHQTCLNQLKAEGNGWSWKMSSIFQI